MNSCLPKLAALVLAGSALAPAAHAQGCGTWTSTPVPMDPAWWEAEFEDVTTLPDGTAWATGHFTVFEPRETFTLAMHWDGARWTHVPTPSPSPYPGGTQAYLHGVAAVAPDDVWAGGERRGDAGGLSVGAWIMVQHWDGSSWELVDVPQPPGGVSINFSGTRIHDVVALASDDVWFGGQWGEPNAAGSVTWRPLAMHWDGSDLEIYPTPAPYEDHYGFGIARMSAVSSNDIWAVCNRLPSSYSQELVVLHWDGSSWDRVTVPTSGEARTMYTVEAIAADDVWIFGEDRWPAGPSDVFALHWDGAGWTEITGAPPARGAFALDADTIYTGAGYYSGHGVYAFDGERWASVESFPGLNVHVFEGERGAGCDGWLVGREMVGGKKPFAARLGEVAFGSGGFASRSTGGWSTGGSRTVGFHAGPALAGTGLFRPRRSGHALALRGPGARPVRTRGRVLDGRSAARRRPARPVARSRGTGPAHGRRGSVGAGDALARRAARRCRGVAPGLGGRPLVGADLAVVERAVHERFRPVDDAVVALRGRAVEPARRSGGPPRRDVSREVRDDAGRSAPARRAMALLREPGHNRAALRAPAPNTP